MVKDHPILDRWYMVWMIHGGHMITRDECGPNSLTFVLWLRELTWPGIKSGPAASEAMMLPPRPLRGLTQTDTHTHLNYGTFLECGSDIESKSIKKNKVKFSGDCNKFLHSYCHSKIKTKVDFHTFQQWHAVHPSNPSTAWTMLDEKPKKKIIK